MSQFEPTAFPDVPTVTSLRDVLDGIESALCWRGVGIAVMHDRTDFLDLQGRVLATCTGTSLRMAASLEPDVLALVQAHQSVVRGMDQLADEAGF